MKLILIRHGQSQWNLENRFTGWTDVDLSDKGRQEAAEAGRRLLDAGIMPQYYFTSYLKRLPPRPWTGSGCRCTRTGT